MRIHQYKMEIAHKKSAHFSGTKVSVCFYSEYGFRCTTLSLSSSYWVVHRLWRVADEGELVTRWIKFRESIPEPRRLKHLVHMRVVHADEIPSR